MSKENYKKSFTILTKNELNSLKAAYTEEIRKFFNEIVEEEKIFDILGDDFKTFYKELLSDIESAEKVKGFRTKIKIYKKLKTHLDHLIISSYLDNLTDEGFENLRKALEDFGADNNIEIISNFLQHKKEYAESLKAKDEKALSQTVPQGLKAPFTKLQFGEAQKLKIMSTPEVERFFEKFSQNGKVIDILGGEFASFYDDIRNEKNFPGNDRSIVSTIAEKRYYENLKIYLEYVVVPAYLENLTKQDIQNFQETILQFGKTHDIKTIEEFFAYTDKRIQAAEEEEKLIAGGSITKKPADSISEGDKKKYIKKPVKLKFSEICYFKKCDSIKMSKTTEKFGNPFSKLNKDVPDILDDEFKSFYKGLKNPNQLFVNPEKEDNEFYFKRSKEIFDSFIDSYLDNLELDGVKSHLEEIKIFGEENNIDLIKKFVDEKEKYILNLAKIEASSKLHNSSFFFSDKTKASANQDEVIINNSTLGKEKENNINAGIKKSSAEQLVSPAEPQLSELQKLQNQTKEVQIESSGNKAQEVTSNTYPHEDPEPEYTPERNERWLKEAERFTNASEQECLDILVNLEKGCLIEKWLQNKDKKFFAGKESFLINYTFKENTFNYEIFNFLLSQGLFYENIKNVNLKISKEGFDNLSSLALRHEDENLIKWLAEKNSLTLKNYFGHPEYEPISAQDELTLKFLEEMIKNGNITLPSLYNGETFLNLFKLLINLSPTFWEDLRNPKKCQFDIKDQSLSGLELAQYLDNIEKLLKGDTSPLRESLFNEYLSTDLESVKKLFEKGLIDLHYVELCAQNTQFSHRNLGISSSQPTVIESDACEKIIAYAIKQDISTRIEKAAKAGNVRLLEQIYSNDKELFYEAFNNPKKQFVNMLKEAVHEVLKSGDIKKVTGKINIKSVSKSKIATDKDLEELLKKPNLLKQIIDYICEKFLSHIGIKSKFQTHAANISEAFVQKLPGNKTHQSKGKQT